MREEEQEAIEKALLQQLILNMLEEESEDDTSEEGDEESEDESDSVEEVVDNEDFEDAEEFIQYGQLLESLKLDYESLFGYLGSFTPVEVDYWNFLGEDESEQEVEHSGEVNLFSNEVMDRIVTMEKMDRTMGTHTHMPVQVRERYELLNKLITYHALFQVKYELWG